MPEEKKEEQVVVQDDLEKKEEKLEIPLNEDGEPKSEAEIKKEAENAKQKEDDQRKHNAEAAQRRLDQEKLRLKKELEDSKRRIAELEKRPSYHIPGQPVVKDGAYWEKRLADDPVGALDEHYKFMRQREFEEQSRYDEQKGLVDSFYKSLEESKEMAIGEFPDLANEESEQFGMFMDILGKHPEWRNSPIGPMKVINEMKKILAKGEGGKDIINRAKSEGANEERERQARISNQPLSGGKQGESKKTFTLTKDQLEYCREAGIKPEQYAKIAMRLGQGEGVSV